MIYVIYVLMNLEIKMKYVLLKIIKVFFLSKRQVIIMGYIMF